MSEIEQFKCLSPTDLANVLPRDRVMSHKIHPLWHGMPRVVGPAFTVRCPAGDHLMLHAAIYRAPAGSVIVLESGDENYAVAGGNVCAIAQKNGIAAFVIDGMIRDLAEVRQRGFAVFARGVIPFPSCKNAVSELNVPVHCGGVEVCPGDMVVADEEGIVVVPVSQKAAVLKDAMTRATQETNTTLADWEAVHRAKVDELLRQKGFVEK